MDYWITCLLKIMRDQIARQMLDHNYPPDIKHKPMDMITMRRDIDRESVQLPP